MDSKPPPSRLSGCVDYRKAAVNAACRVDAQRWSELFTMLMDTIEARFARPESRRRSRDFVAGQLAPLPTKNCWTVAEHAGAAGPGGLQDLIGRASWDDALVRTAISDDRSKLAPPPVTLPAWCRDDYAGSAVSIFAVPQKGRPVADIVAEGSAADVSDGWARPGPTLKMADVPASWAFVGATSVSWST